MFAWHEAMQYLKGKTMIKRGFASLATLLVVLVSGCRQEHTWVASTPSPALLAAGMNVGAANVDLTPLVSKDLTSSDGIALVERGLNLDTPENCLALLERVKFQPSILASVQLDDFEPFAKGLADHFVRSKPSFEQAEVFVDRMLPQLTNCSLEKIFEESPMVGWTTEQVIKLSHRARPFKEFGPPSLCDEKAVERARKTALGKIQSVS